MTSACFWTRLIRMRCVAGFSDVTWRSVLVGTIAASGRNCGPSNARSRSPALRYTCAGASAVFVAGSSTDRKLNANAACRFPSSPNIAATGPGCAITIPAGIERPIATRSAKARWWWLPGNIRTDLIPRRPAHRHDRQSELEDHPECGAAEVDLVLIARQVDPQQIQ